MTAFLKIDRCRECSRELPWEWVPPVTLGDKPLAGTGVWRSMLVNDRCPSCTATAASAHARARRAKAMREQFIRLVGGVKPYRDFTFQRYQITASNRDAFERARQFDPSKDNLYLWGPCGVGKTHLAVSILRQAFARGASIALVTVFQLIRRLRMKTPEEEQSVIDEFTRVNLLVLDDMGSGGDTTYARQVVQEILDGRTLNDKGGLVVTSQYSLNALTNLLHHRAISSRLNGMCQVVEIRGVDQRRNRNNSGD